MEVSTSYRLAGIGSRFIALAIDSALIGAISGIFGLNNAWLIGGLLSFIVGVGYQWMFLTRNNGQTPGKMLLGIRVIKADGTAISEMDVFMRYVGYILNSALLMLGWLWAMVDPERQGLHDKLARTYVVHAERERVQTVNGDKAKREY